MDFINFYSGIGKLPVDAPNPSEPNLQCHQVRAVKHPRGSLDLQPVLRAALARNSVDSRRPIHPAEIPEIESPISRLPRDVLGLLYWKVAPMERKVLNQVCQAFRAIGMHKPGLKIQASEPDWEYRERMQRRYDTQCLLTKTQDLSIPMYLGEIPGNDATIIQVPGDIIGKILCYLGKKDREAASRTCTAFAKIVNGERGAKVHAASLDTDYQQQRLEVLRKRNKMVPTINAVNRVACAIGLRKSAGPKYPTYTEAELSGERDELDDDLYGP